MPVALRRCREGNPALIEQQLDRLRMRRPDRKDHEASRTNNATGKEANNAVGDTSRCTHSSVKQLRHEPPGKGNPVSPHSPDSVMVKRGTTAMRLSPRRNASRPPIPPPRATTG